MAYLVFLAVLVHPTTAVATLLSHRNQARKILIKKVNFLHKFLPKNTFGNLSFLGSLTVGAEIIHLLS